MLDVRINILEHTETKVASNTSAEKGGIWRFYWEQSTLCVGHPGTREVEQDQKLRASLGYMRPWQ